MTTVAKKLNSVVSAELKLTPVRKRILMTLCVILMAGVSYGSWIAIKSDTILKTEKQEALKLIDKTTAFGQVILNQDGTIVSWNKGMTAMFGYTSAEMRGGNLSVLDPISKDSGVLHEVGHPQENPWRADGFLYLRSKNGEKNLIRVSVRDITSSKTNKRFRRITFDANTKTDAETPFVFDSREETKKATSK